MIKVYFGPWKHSPVKPISGNESVLSIGDFHLLRGYDRDFWTNNPFVLDCFKPEQIMVYLDGWMTLPEAVERTIPPEDVERTSKLQPGKQALAVEVIRLVELHCETDSKLDPEKVKADIRAALLH
jgi:hypothetical protein